MVKENFYTQEEYMRLFVFVLVIVCFFLGQNRRGSKNPQALMGKDDFTGDSIRSLFLLEEIVDLDDGSLVPANHRFAQSEKAENNYFENKDEYFENEFFEYIVGPSEFVKICDHGCA